MAGRVPSIQGKTYSNRTDLQMSPQRRPATPPQPVGRPNPQQGPSTRAPANPLGLAPAAPGPASVPTAAPAGNANTPVDFTMESVPNLTDMSQRPDESVLTGAQVGFQPDSGNDPLAMRLRAAYLADPDPDLADIIIGLDRESATPIAPMDGGMVPGGPRFRGVI